jgi:hypothetical protein
MNRVDSTGGWILVQPHEETVHTTEDEHTITIFEPTEQNQSLLDKCLEIFSQCFRHYKMKN